MKLSGLTIFIIGLSVAIVALSYAYFHHWEPNMQTTANLKTQAEALKTEIQKDKKAQERVDKAIALVKEKSARWNEIAQQRTVPPSLASGGINLGRHAWQLTVDSRRFRNFVQQDINRQVKYGGVTVVNGPEVPDPPMEATTVLANYFNYPAIPFPVVIYDFGTVTVRGTYRQITENVRAWSRIPKYLAVADGLVLTGTSPELVGTYNLSVVGFVQGKEILPQVPEGSVGNVPGGGGPGGGGPGGPGGGGPGGGRGGGAGGGSRAGAVQPDI